MGHGGNIYEIEEQWGIPKGELIDYSANINPLGVPLEIREMIHQQVDALINYPDPNYNDLKVAISSFYKIEKDDIILGNGAAEVIHSYIKALKPQKCLTIQPTFSEYQESLEQVGAEFQEIYLREEDNFQLSIENVISSIDYTIDLIILCNPNNPTSTLISKPDLLRLIRHCSDNNVYIMIDEAFMDFVDEEGSITLLKDYGNYHNLFIVRAFTKFFGIPGLRLGFGVSSNKTIISKLKRSSLPWNINTFASSFGIMLSDNQYISETYRWMREEKLYFVNSLKNIHSLKVFNPEANFILIKIMEDGLSTAMLKKRLLQYKILIRECSNFKGLNDKFFRIAIKDSSTNEYFLKAIGECLKK